MPMTANRQFNVNSPVKHEPPPPQVDPIEFFLSSRAGPCDPVNSPQNHAIARIQRWQTSKVDNPACFILVILHIDCHCRCSAVITAVSVDRDRKSGVATCKSRD